MERQIQDNSSLLKSITSVLEVEAQALQEAKGRMETQAVTAEGMLRAIALLQESLEAGGKIVVSGIGKSGKIGEKIAATFSSTGTPALFLHPTEGLHGDLGIVQPRDCVLAISHTGNTDELLRLLPSLKARQAKIIALCGNKQARLVQNADAWVDSGISSEACPHNLAPTSSTTLALALGDALAVTLMRIRGFDAQAFAKNHPGGSLGARLTLRVEDLMHRPGTAEGEFTPVTPQASMDSILTESTRQKLGALVVVDPATGKLAGIITDGDIRRALQHRERFFHLKAADVMTSQPAWIGPQEMAWSALEQMENRPSQINVLPVLDPDRHPMGLIRLHDLVRTL
jgi:arabinose-5-phosphate isomerase